MDAKELNQLYRLLNKIKREDNDIPDFLIEAIDKVRFLVGGRIDELNPDYRRLIE